jgi:integrase
MIFTSQTVRSLELPPGKADYTVFDDSVGGFGLRLRQSKHGIRRTWVYQFDLAGRTRKISIGDVTLPVPEARRIAVRLQAEVRLGHDPATRAAVLEVYLPIKEAKLRPRSYVETRRHLMVGCRRLHQLPLRSITTAMITSLYETMVKERGATTATNCWRTLHAFLGFALRQGHIDRNPAIGVELRKMKPRSRVLNAKEIKALWLATADGSDYSKIIRLLLLSGARASEIAKLQFSEIESERIVLAPERTKTDRGRSIPLTPSMRAILDVHPRRDGHDYVFGKPERPFSSWNVCKQALDQRLGADMPKWVVHDLRRTVATNLGELGISPWVISAVLGHAVGRSVLVFDQPAENEVTRKHCNFAKLEEPVRNALTAWDDHVMGIVAGRVADKRVLRFKK